MTHVAQVAAGVRCGGLCAALAAALCGRDAAEVLAAALARGWAGKDRGEPDMLTTAASRRRTVKSERGLGDGGDGAGRARAASQTEKKPGARAAGASTRHRTRRPAGARTQSRKAAARPVQHAPVSRVRQPERRTVRVLQPAHVRRRRRRDGAGTATQRQAMRRVSRVHLHSRWVRPNGLRFVPHAAFFVEHGPAHRRADPQSPLL